MPEIASTVPLLLHSLKVHCSCYSVARFGVECDCGGETECAIDSREVAVDAGGHGFDEEVKRVCVCEMVDDRPRTMGVLTTAVDELVR